MEGASAAEKLERGNFEIRGIIPLVGEAEISVIGEDEAVI